MYESSPTAIRPPPGQPPGNFMFLKKKVFKKVLKSFRRVLKSKNTLKS
jgi:hypothetical protein